METLLRAMGEVVQIATANVRKMNKLILGDCLQELKKIEDCSCDISFTSPPYNRKRNDKYDNYDDSINDYSAFLIDVIDQMLRVTKRNVFFNIQKNFYNKQDVFEIIGHYSKKICDPPQLSYSWSYEAFINSNRS